MAVVSGQLSAAGATVLPEGTPVRMRLTRNLSSADAKVNDNIDFETLDDVKVGDVVVIPKGSVAMATITEAAAKRSMGRAGKLNVNIDYVRLPSNERLALRGVQDMKGGGKSGTMTGAMVATSIVFFPAAPLFLFMKGKDITIPKGHEVTVYTNTDYTVGGSKAAVAQSSAAPSAPATSGSMTNADVLKLKAAGFGDELIVAKIKSSKGEFKLDTDALLELKKAGISDAVLSAMIGAGR
jgi:hydrogenase maturation factor